MESFFTTMSVPAKFLLAFIPTACLLALVLADAWRRPLRRALAQLALSMLSLQAFLFVSLLVPLCLFDPQAAGYDGKPLSIQALILGASHDEVLATEAEIATSGIG